MYLQEIKDIDKNTRVPTEKTFTYCSMNKQYMEGVHKQKLANSV